MRCICAFLDDSHRISRNLLNFCNRMLHARPRAALQNRSPPRSPAKQPMWPQTSAPFVCQPSPRFGKSSMRTTAHRNRSRISATIKSVRNGRSGVLKSGLKGLQACPNRIATCLYLNMRDATRSTGTKGIVPVPGLAIASADATDCVSIGASLNQAYMRRGNEGHGEGSNLYGGRIARFNAQAQLRRLLGRGPKADMISISMRSGIQNMV